MRSALGPAGGSAYPWTHHDARPSFLGNEHTTTQREAIDSLELDVLLGGHCYLEWVSEYGRIDNHRLIKVLQEWYCRPVVRPRKIMFQ